MSARELQEAIFWLVVGLGALLFIWAIVRKNR
jgi:hypothetical protein